MKIPNFLLFSLIKGHICVPDAGVQIILLFQRFEQVNALIYVHVYMAMVQRVEGVFIATEQEVLLVPGLTE